MDAPAPVTVGKADLAKHLGWTRPKLDRRLASDPAFPIVSRGDQSGGWKFDLAQVDRYMRGAPQEALPPLQSPPVDQAQLRDSVAPPRRAAAGEPASRRRSAHHEGEATAKQRKDAADALLKEDKLAEARGELVSRAELRMVLAQVFAALGNDLDAVPDDIARDLGRPDDAPIIRAAIDKVRTRLVKNADPLLKPPPADA